MTGRAAARTGGFRIDLTAVSDNAGIEAQSLLGQAVRIDLLTQRSRTTLRPFHGHVTRFERVGANGGLARYWDGGGALDGLPAPPPRQLPVPGHVGGRRGGQRVRQLQRPGQAGCTGAGIVAGPRAWRSGDGVSQAAGGRST
ncbi:protein of unknown function (plasmid) [Cupriavidus taiwanensis]|uniref:Uncharacterized protein n=1 Tax=Cupriavidus taiwanensis TaxID=164546 RepID=A0A7Z7JGY5_9BURK|nr:protein of unknown function [Cupriavidus taiwanensis]SPC23063.1 protein of unknown function [Cupriavidus taiwanensis]SPD54571.1 protein of unknown function [Cupriavidus taiwanensis]